MEPPKKKNYIDRDSVIDLREAIEAKGFHIATNDELAWLNKPMTERDTRMVDWAQTLEYMEWTKICPEKADTYKGWKVLNDIAKKLSIDEKYSR